MLWHLPRMWHECQTQPSTKTSWQERWLQFCHCKFSTPWYTNRSRILEFIRGKAWTHKTSLTSTDSFIKEISAKNDVRIVLTTICFVGGSCIIYSYLFTHTSVQTRLLYQMMFVSFCSNTTVVMFRRLFFVLFLLAIVLSVLRRFIRLLISPLIFSNLSCDNTWIGLW
jgi:hypothetical protein